MSGRGPGSKIKTARRSRFLGFPRLPTGFDKGRKVDALSRFAAEEEARLTRRMVSSNRRLPPSLVVNPAAVQRKRMLGRIVDPATGNIVSARLNPELAAAASTIDVILDSDEGRAQAEAFLAEGAANADMMTAGRRQRGGEHGDILRLYGILDIDGVEDQVEALKVVAMAAIFNSKEAVKDGWATSEPMRQASKKFFIENYGPLYTTGGRLLGIIGGLADQLIVKVPVTTVMLTTAAAGYTLNFFSWVFRQYNDLGRAVAEDLLSDERAKSAAAAAVGNAKEALKTVGVVAFVANQLGLLPVSAVLAAILWQLQATLGTGGGRAYLVGGFYAWYQGQSPATQTAIKTAAKKYAADAQSAAKKNAPAVKAAAGESAAVLATLLAKGSAATGNAFQAVAKAITNNNGTVSVAAPAAEAPVQTALVEGAPAAALAAEQAGAGAAPGPDVAAVGDGAPAAVGAPKVRKSKRAAPLDPSVAAAQAFVPGSAAASADAMVDVGHAGGRRKTRKLKSKRRVTRRRKAQKILGTPVFIY